MAPRWLSLTVGLAAALEVRGQDAAPLAPSPSPSAPGAVVPATAAAPQGAAGVAASQRAGSGTSQVCPDLNPMRSLALGYWYTTWGKMQCGRTFEEESLGISVRDVPDQPAQCEVVLYRPAGDLRVRVVPSSGSVVAAWVRPPERRGPSGWRSVDRRVCLLSSVLGAAPWIEPIPPEIVQTAYDSLLATRQRSQLAQRMCGQTLSLVATQGINGIVELTAQRVERLFFLEVLEGGVTSTVIPVQVLVEESQRVNPENNGTDKVYRLLSSTPSACQISASMPFAAFGCAASAAGPNGGAAAIARRLQDVQIRQLEDRTDVLQKGPCEVSTQQAVSLQELHDISEAQNNRSDPEEWRAEVGPMALYHEKVGPETFEQTHLGDRTPREAMRGGGLSNGHRAASKRLALAAARSLQAVTGDHRFPDSYDLRRNFPQCSQPARATGQCSASWAFAAVGAFEKQLCRLSGGQVSEVLSRQRVLDCASTARGCAGGSIFDAHAAMLMADSVVTESCYGFRGGFDAGSAPAHLPQCPPVDAGCSGRYAARFPSPAEVAYQTRLASTMPEAAATNVLVGEKAMQAAILLYGAIVASFAVYPEFLAYRQGIYRARQFNEQTRLGTHAVQLLGWGSNPTGDKYWIAENSWGTWGENQDFQRCSVVDCRGRLCPAPDNLNPDCSDSAVWQDAFGNGCDWYRAYDPGCEVYPDGGQMTQCRRACRNCLPPPTRSGEECGYFRIVRGSNHLGIESFATHTYVAGLAPPEDLFSDLAPTCEDDVSWLDGWGSGCTWYQSNDPGCVNFQDYGQQEFCRRTCATCPLQLAQVAPPLSQRSDARRTLDRTRAVTVALTIGVLLASTYGFMGDREHRAH